MFNSDKVRYSEDKNTTYTHTYCEKNNLDHDASRLLNILMILCAMSTSLMYCLNYLQQPGEQSLYTFQVKSLIDSDLNSNSNYRF